MYGGHVHIQTNCQIQARRPDHQSHHVRKQFHAGRTAISATLLCASYALAMLGATNCLRCARACQLHACKGCGRMRDTGSMLHSKCHEHD